MFEGTRERPYVSLALQLSLRRLPLSTLRFSAHYRHRESADSSQIFTFLCRKAEKFL